MTFKEFMNKYYGSIKPETEEWIEYGHIWRAAEREDHLSAMEEYVKMIEASYQSKRDKLKKQTTHMTGKFMIVKAENNKIRAINKAITIKNAELTERIIFLEAITLTRVEEAVTTHYKQPLRLPKEGYNVKIKC